MENPKDNVFYCARAHFSRQRFLHQMSLGDYDRLNYILIPAPEQPSYWECGLCCDADQGSLLNYGTLVWHPSNCHVFHDACLNTWLSFGNIACPWCNSCTTPLNCRDSDIECTPRVLVSM